MKGIILAGGVGKRLAPLTTVCNKALLPVYNKPMICHAIEFLVNSGIDKIAIVIGTDSIASFVKLLKNGEDYNLKELHYIYQKQPAGIAQALGLAKNWVAGDNMVLMLSDNFFEHPIKEALLTFNSGCTLFLAKVDDPRSYGVAVFESTKLMEIQEKPAVPKSNWAVTGLYAYDNNVWDIINTLQPSARGELEITDVNNVYIKQKSVNIIKLVGKWTDSGEDFDALLNASIWMQSLKNV